MAKRRSKEIVIEIPEISDKTIIYGLIGLIVIVNLATTYFTFQVSKNMSTLLTNLQNQPAVPQQPAQAPENQTQEQQPEDPMALLSPETRQLVQTYGVSGTPTLVINCEKQRIGSIALAEERGSVPKGTEEQDLINKFCDVSNNPVFCNNKKQLGEDQTIALESTNQPKCGSDTKVRVYVFRSPTCPYCESQVPILNSLEQKYPNNLEIIHVCTPIHGVDDVDLCKQQSDKYDMI